MINLKLDVSDAITRDTLRGPGSSSTEQIPSASPVLHSPLASSIDPYRYSDRTDAAETFTALKEEKIAFESGRVDEEEEHKLHIVVVGGDVGAFLTALALAKSEQVRVTLVNAGLGSLSALGSESVPRGSQLIAHVLGHLDELGNWGGPSQQVPPDDSPFDMEGRSGRWKGKGAMHDVISIGDRIREEGFRHRTFQLRRYSTGEILASQSYAVSTGEDVSMIGIDTDTLVTILRDTCLSHPRIDIRPRGIVRSVLPGAPASQSTRQSVQQRNPSNNGRPASSSSQASKSSKPAGPVENAQERRRRVRESFIQLDDDEHDYASMFSATSTHAGADPMLLDFLRNLPAHSPGPSLFSTEDLPGDTPLPPLHIASELEKEQNMCNPEVILTSGERIVADAIIGTEGPESKVLDAIPSTGSDTHGDQIVHEDGVFRATVPISKLLRDPELRDLTGKSVNWLGPGRTLNMYPISYNSVYVQLTVEGHRARRNIDEDEAELVAQRMKDEVRDWCPTVRNLVGVIDSASYEPVLDYNVLEKWVSNPGRVAALGDATRPVLVSSDGSFDVGLLFTRETILQPFSHATLGPTIHDALTLGALFSKLPSEPAGSYSDVIAHSRALIPRLLYGYATLCRPNCLRKQLTFREGRDLFLLQDGEQQKQRDRTLKLSGFLDDEEMRKEWLFDPFMEVENWWAREMQRTD